MSRLLVTIDDRQLEVELDLCEHPGSIVQARIGDRVVEVFLAKEEILPGKPGVIFLDGQAYEFLWDPDQHAIQDYAGLHPVQIRSLDKPSLPCRRGDGRVKAPIPGQIVDVRVGTGHKVAVGEPLIVLEAMKMQNEITAPCSGNVKQVLVELGENVRRGQVLVEIE